jgi:molybdate transport system ATP-binding protein
MIELDVYKQLDSANGPMTLSVQTTVQQGEFVVLYGSSGAGKTSLLRMIAGFMTPDRGRITVNDTVWYNSAAAISLPPQQRKPGFVFQDYALFPNMTVRENLEFAAPKNTDPATVAELLELAELTGLQHHKPDTLSGGQKQRTALIRAIAARPQLLLLDEPLAALDHAMRIKLREFLRKIHKQTGLTVLMVSHDVAEIIQLADRVLEISEGKISREGKPAELFRSGTTSAKFSFNGEVLSVEKSGVIFIVTVLVGNELVQVVADPSEINDLKPGDKVSVAAKAFNPALRKIGQMLY